MVKDSHQVSSLDDVLEYIDSARFSSLSQVPEIPLRCLKRRADSDGLTLQDFDGQPYVAVSYTWPGSWNRLHNSNVPSKVWRGTACESSEHISRFFLHVFDQLLLEEQSYTFWVDQCCINQSDALEKQQQVAIMDRIYSNAFFTAVILEDIELTFDELEFIKSSRRRVGKERQKFVLLVRRILEARWFKRAWCSQEFLLSRSTQGFVHQTGKSKEPIRFASDTLGAWVTKARVYDATVPRLSERRGVASMYQPVRGLVYVGSFAWAYGVVQSMGCHNVYDKIALVLNLVRTPLDRRLASLPDPKGNLHKKKELHVAGIVNVLALRNNDYSLLQAGHQYDNTLLGIDGLGWAALPAKGDVIADGWHARIYEAQQDPNVAVTAVGLKLKGLLDRIVAYENWSIKRSHSDLYITVGAHRKTIRSSWLTSSDDQIAHDGMGRDDTGSSPYDRELPMAKLRDILYAIEAFDAEELWPTFMPADGTWTLRKQDDAIRSDSEGSLRSRMLKEYIRPGTTQRTMATGALFLHQDDETRFTVLTLSKGFRMVVGGNITNMQGCDIFQPFVMRLNEFGAHGVACNAFVLQNASRPAFEGVRRVAGHIRCFQLVPHDTKQQTLILR